mmetsp:Transcript_64950/g.95097  ORF Transcript_64950/g.95097 Transcript_64950/m.95097 type:complete len:446 (-) Transcript_64950:84-1421(-)
MVLPPAPIINPAGAAAGSSDRVPKQNKGTQRWRSGKAPEWAPSSGGDGAAAAGGEAKSSRPARQVEEPAVLSSRAVTHDATDRRLRRLAEGRAAAGKRRELADAEILEGDDDDDEDERQAREARNMDDDEDEQQRAGSDDEDESEDEDKMEARRARVRELAKKRRAGEQEEEIVAEEEDEEEKKGDSSDSWEYETDSDQEDDLRLVKPVFVTKSNRATLEERERIEREELEEDKMKVVRAATRKQETRKIVAEELQKEKQAIVDRNTRQKNEDTDEEGHEEEEYDKWRLRELKRIKRDREEKEKFERERADTERRRGMSDKEIMAENSATGKGSKSKASMVFMQKYHHKGAFFMENDEANLTKEAIYNRDTNEATAADRATAKQAQAGPYEGSKVLQVRTGKFGKIGQTKWTHLMAEDTSKQDSPWAQGDDAMRRKIQKKLGGHG